MLRKLDWLFFLLRLGDFMKLLKGPKGINIYGQLKDPYAKLGDFFLRTAGHAGRSWAERKGEWTERGDLNV